MVRSENGLHSESSSSYPLRDSAIAVPTSAVLRFALPRVSRSRVTAAAISAAASLCPRWVNIMATDEIVAVGSASCLPAISGAEPWIGSNIDGNLRVGLILPEAASPIPPLIAAAISVMMSPKRLSVTTTSRR